MSTYAKIQRKRIKGLDGRRKLAIPRKQREKETNSTESRFML